MSRSVRAVDAVNGVLAYRQEPRWIGPVRIEARSVHDHPGRYAVIYRVLMSRYGRRYVYSETIEHSTMSAWAAEELSTALNGLDDRAVTALWMGEARDCGLGDDL